MPIRPYSFEPTVDDIDMVNVQPNVIRPKIQFDGQSTTNVNYWCLCNKCIEFNTDRECICYFEFEKLHKLLPNSNNKTRIMKIISLSKVILDKEVLSYRN